MNNDKEIIIDLKESLNPETFNETSNILQRDAFSRLTEIVKEHKKQLPQSDESGKKSFRSLRSHNSVFISGARGSGKTTFLLNIKTVICDESTGRPYILDIIDPTLIHDNDNFLSIVLGRIADTVKKRSSYGSNDGNGNSAKEFFNKLSEVAELSEAISNSQQSTGLDNILDEQNALNLEIEIHNLMEIAVKVLNCPFLILPIDDIDMSFVHGFEVLEKIRKYLATPYIMPVISGDIEMYHQIFTVEFFRQMTHNKEISDEQIQKLYEKRKQRFVYNSDDKARSMYFISKSYTLSDRYLEKVLPRNRRITLKKAQEIIKKDAKIIIAKEHPWDGKLISYAIAQIKRNFNLHCGYATREKNVFDDENAPVPTNNLRELLQFLDQTKDAFTNEGINFQLLNKRIMDFYEFGGSYTDRVVFDFAKANYAAYEDKRKFSIKRFAQSAHIDEYFSYSDTQNKLVAYYSKSKKKGLNKNKFENPTNNLEKLFYIITFEADISNGSRIFISPDKFFLWITAKLFSPSDISQNDEKYSFGFENKIFTNDSQRVQKAEIDDIIDDNNADTKKRADDYERIKYEELENKDLFIEELGHFEDINCSASFIYYMYTKFRKNVDKILSYMKTSPTEYTFATLAKKLIIVYANAFAWASIQSKRFSANNICLKAEKIFELKARDMAFKWNINAWKSDNIEDEKTNELTACLQNFINQSSLSAQTKKLQQTSEETNLLLGLLSCLLKIFGLEDERNQSSFLGYVTIDEPKYSKKQIQPHPKQSSEKQANKKLSDEKIAINKIKTNFTEYLKKTNTEGINDSELVKKIIESNEFKEAKRIAQFDAPWWKRSFHKIGKYPSQTYDTVMANLGIK